MNSIAANCGKREAVDRDREALEGDRAPAQEKVLQREKQIDVLATKVSKEEAEAYLTG